MSKFGRRHVSVFAAGAIVLTAACKEARDTGAVTSKSGGTTSSAPSSEAVEELGLALVRVVNALPGGGPISVSAGDSTAFGAVTYKMATPYREIPDDAFKFKLRVDAAETGSEPLAVNRENLKKGGHYTIIAMPDQGGADKANMRLLDDELKPVTDGKARVRFLNAVPGDQDVDLILRGRAEPLFDGVNFKTEAGWREVEPLGGALEVRPDGKETVLARLSNVKLDSSRSYTFVLSGRPGNYEIISIVDDVARS
jgi:uncharacterized protein DUF4397